MSMIILPIITLIPVFIFTVFIPYWTRKTESFGVTIPENIYYTDVLKKLRKQYAYTMSGFSLIVTTVFLLLGNFYNYNEDEIGTLLIVSISAYLFTAFLIYLIFHNKMKKMKLEQNWSHAKSQVLVVDTNFHNQKLSYSHYWYLIPLSVAIITAILSMKFYPQFPDNIPMNYDLSGNITKSISKSYFTVMLFPMVQILLTMLFIFINWIIAKSKQQISAEDPEKSIAQNIVFRKRWSLFMLISGSAMVLMFSMIQLSLIYTINQTLLLTVSLVFTFGTIAGAIILSITTGQGGSRIGKRTNKTGNTIDRDDDQYWKLGIFYYNKNDPTIFLEKRFGIGWTNNWAHPLSWIIILIILASVGIPFIFI